MLILAQITVATDTTTFEYDERNRLTKTTDALNNVTQTEYDLLGREAARIDALGRRTEMEYYVFGRLQTTTYPDLTKDFLPTTCVSGHCGCITPGLY